MQLNIIICGVGGQGNLLASVGIANYSMKKGLNVLGTETIGAAQRGGSVISHIRISDKELYSPLVPAGKADILMAFEPLEAVRHLKLVNPEGSYILNIEPVPTVSCNMGMDTYPSLSDILATVKEACPKGHMVDASTKARELGNFMMTNMIMLGALTGVCSFFDSEEFVSVLSGVIPAKVLDANIKAFKEGIKMIQEIA